MQHKAQHRITKGGKQSTRETRKKTLLKEPVGAGRKSHTASISG